MMDNMQAAIENAERDLERARLGLIGAGRSLIRTLEIAIAHAERGRLVNGLGELQSSGTMFDVRCGVYMERRDALSALRSFADAS